MARIKEGVDEMKEEIILDEIIDRLELMKRAIQKAFGHASRIEQVLDKLAGSRLTEKEVKKT